MAETPIIDTHVHLWDPNVFDYPWLEAHPELHRPYVFEAYDGARGPIEIEKMIFIECMSVPSKFLDELAWVASLTEQDSRLAAIIPTAALERGDVVRPDLERISEYALVPGVRRLIQDEPDIDFCVQEKFVQGIRHLAAFDLHFELCIYHIHLANTIRLVQQCPDVRFILDHIGKPNIREHVLQPWRRQLQELAQLPNVWCKISGVATEADHDRWTREDLRPYIEHAIECFGFDRVMYGSDWPVATWATEYPRWVETLQWVVADASEEERRKLFHDNALSFYRI